MFYSCINMERSRNFRKSKQLDTELRKRGGRFLRFRKRFLEDFLGQDPNNITTKVLNIILFYTVVELIDYTKKMFEKSYHFITLHVF